MNSSTLHTAPSFPLTSMSLDRTSDLYLSASPKTDLLNGDTTDCGDSMISRWLGTWESTKTFNKFKWLYVKQSFKPNFKQEQEELKIHYSKTITAKTRLENTSLQVSRNSLGRSKTEKISSMWIVKYIKIEKGKATLSSQMWKRSRKLQFEFLLRAVMWVVN